MAKRKHGWDANECAYDEPYDENDVAICYKCGGTRDESIEKSGKDEETGEDTIEKVKSSFLKANIMRMMSQIDAGVRDANGNLVANGEDDNDGDDSDDDN